MFSFLEDVTELILHNFKGEDGCHGGRDGVWGAAGGGVAMCVCVWGGDKARHS